MHADRSTLMCHSGHVTPSGTGTASPAVRQVNSDAVPYARASARLQPNFFVLFTVAVHTRMDLTLHACTQPHSVTLLEPNTVYPYRWQNLGNWMAISTMIVETLQV